MLTLIAIAVGTSTHPPHHSNFTTQKSQQAYIKMKVYLFLVALQSRQSAELGQYDSRSLEHLQLEGLMLQSLVLASVRLTCQQAQSCVLQAQVHVLQPQKSLKAQQDS